MYSLYDGYSQEDHTRVAYVHPSLQTVNRVIKMNILGGQRSFGFMTLQKLPNHKPAPAHLLTTQDDVDPHWQFRISCSWNHKVRSISNGKADMSDVPSIGWNLILLRMGFTWLRIWHWSIEMFRPPVWHNVQPSAQGNADLALRGSHNPETFLNQGGEYHQIEFQRYSL